MKKIKTFRSVWLVACLLAASLGTSTAFAQAESPFASMQKDGAGLRMASSGLPVGDSATYTLYLNNLPAGTTGAEFVCSYDDTIVSVDNLQAVNLPGETYGMFGEDAISTSNTPADGSFTYAVASMPPNTAIATGGVFSIDVTGVSAGEFDFSCNVRIAKNSLLTAIPFTPVTIDVVAPATEALISGTILEISQVYSGTKTVTIHLTDGGSVDLTHTVDLGDGGTFSFNVDPGTYTIEASAPGYLRAEQSGIVVVAGDEIAMENLLLLAGDIDGNDSINATDVVTLGANYNLTTPAAADLNGSGRINLLDLQLLAPNYGISGATDWQTLP